MGVTVRRYTSQAAWQKRIGVICIIATAGLATTASAESAPKDSFSRLPLYSNASIAETALRYVGLWGGQACIDARHDASGQCKQFVNCVVSLASKGQQYPVDPDGNYQTSYLRAGGEQVPRSSATRGDVIQVGTFDSDMPLHTAIVLADHHDGAFTVVDANWIGAPSTPELVGVHVWSPPTAAEFWRFGTVSDGDPVSAGLPAETSDPQELPAPTLRLLSDATGGFQTASTVSTPAAMVRAYVDGKPAASSRVVAQHATISLPRSLGSAVHTIAVQAISDDGRLSPLSAAASTLTPTAGSQQPTATNLATASTPMGSLMLTVPNGPLIAGDATIRSTSSGRLHNLRLLVDGLAATATVAPGQSTVTWDSSTVATGTHALTLQATDATGATVTSAPAAVTVAAFALDHRATVNNTGTGHQDLLGVDSTGRLTLYQGTDIGFAPGIPLSTDSAFRRPITLLAGAFTDPAQLQLITIDENGNAQLRTMDMPGHLAAPIPIDTSTDLKRYSKITSGRFDGTPRSQLIGIAPDGHADLLTVAPDGSHLTASPAGLMPPAARAKWIETADINGTGTDSLIIIAPDGTLTSQSLLPSHELTAPAPLGHIDPRAIAGQPVLGQFGSDPLPQMLYTTPTGTTTTLDKAQWNSGG